jgi:ABC-type transporter MlaC component
VLAIRLLALLFLLPLTASAATEDADDWKMIAGALSLVQQIVHQAAASPDPDAAQKGVEIILAGENAQANRIAAGVLADVLQDIPAEQRALFVSIGRDLLILARRERERIERTERSAPPPADPARSLPPAR